MNPYSSVLRRIKIEPRAPPRFDAPEGHSWVFGAKLGAGGFGRAYLWNLVSNAEQKVVDRVVLKYTELVAMQVIGDDRLGHGQISEVFIQKSLVPNGTPPSQVFTVPLLGAEHCSWSLDAWRYYMPYFAFGDLYGLIQGQGTPYKPRREFPEPFAWYLLHRLVSAAVVMDTAFHNGDTKYEVVHVDLKPKNIFMGAPGSLGKNNSFPAYPPAYLGDFGNSYITYHGDPDNEARTFGGCTPGWSAPEITGYPGCREDWQLPSGSHTNIWQIGYIVQSLLECRNHHAEDGIDWHDYPNHEYVPEYSPPYYSERKYSPELLDTLTAMMQWKVDARPTAQEVLHTIEAHMPRFTQGMERWGTDDWFEELDRGDVDPSIDESMVSESTPLRGGRRKNTFTENLIKKFKYLLCFPTARPKHRKNPIDRAISPASVAKARARAASRKRRRDLVERQIREGLRPDVQSSDPADDIFVLEDDLKIMHPPHRDSATFDYFDARDPVPTTYREDIDDVERFVAARKAHEALEEAKPGNAPSVGVETYDFRKDGFTPGEIVYPRE